MKTKKIFFLFLVALILFLSMNAEAIRLREYANLAKDEGITYYGLTTGRFIGVTPDSIIFLNHKLEKIFSQQIKSDEQVVVTENALFYAIYESLGDDPSDTGSIYLTVHNNRRQPIWGSLIESGGSYFLSPNGNYILAVYDNPKQPASRICFYHKDYPLKTFSLSAFKGLMFSEDGTRLFINTGSGGTFLFDESGEKIMGLESVLNSCFGDNASYIATFYRGLVEVYRDSVKVWSFDNKKMHLNSICLSETENKVILLYSNNIVGIDMYTDSILYQYPTALEDGQYTLAEISPDNGKVGCGVDINKGTGVAQYERHTQGFLYIYDIEGTSYDKMEFNYESYKLNVPIVRFMADNRSIVVETNEQYHFIEMY